MIVAYLAFVMLIFIGSYIYLAFYHRTALLFNVAVHEDGKRTLLQTIFCFDHFLGQWPMLVIFSFFLAGAFLLFSPPGETQVAGSWAGALILAVIIIIYLGVIITGSLTKIGLEETKRIMLQWKENDSVSSYGGNWNMMVLSNIILMFVAISAAAILSSFSERTIPNANPAGILYISISIAIFIALCIIFKTGISSFKSPRWLAHSVREVVTHAPLTIMITLLFLQLFAGANRQGAQNLGISGIISGFFQSGWIIIPLIAAIIIFSYNVLSIIGKDTGDLAQKPSWAIGGKLSIPYLLASHFFEHSLDYVFVLLMALFLYLEHSLDYVFVPLVALLLYCLYRVAISERKSGKDSGANDARQKDSMNKGDRNTKDTNWMYDEVPLPHGGSGRNRHWKEQIGKYFGKDELAGKRILDAGCGTGTVTKILAEYSDKVYACDISPNSIAIARKYAPDVRYKISNVLKLGYPDEYFDVVVCIGVIHHTNDAYKAYSELVRVTKKGGKILLFVYNKLHPYYPIYNLSRPLFRNKKAEDIPHFMIDAFGFFVQRFYKEKLSYDEKEHWFSDIFLTPIAHHYSLGTIKKWVRKNNCRIEKVGYTLLRMNLLTLMVKNKPYTLGGKE